MPALPLTRRSLLGGGLILGGAYLAVLAWGHRPVAGGKTPFLGASPRATLVAAFEVILPPSADVEALVTGVDDFLAAGDPVLGEQLRLALTVLEHGVGASPLSPWRFSRQDAARRLEVLEAWRQSRWGTKRQIADAVRRVALFTWYTQPASWAHIGYDGPWVKR